MFDRANKQTRIITGGDDGLVKIWCKSSGLLMETLVGHPGEITDMDIDPTNSLLATGSSDGTMGLWDLQTGQPLLSLHVGKVSSITSLWFSPALIASMRYLLVTTDAGEVFTAGYSVTSKSMGPLDRLEVDHLVKDAFGCSAINCTGSRFAIGCTDGFVRVYSAVEKGFQIEAMAIGINDSVEREFSVSGSGDYAHDIATQNSNRCDSENEASVRVSGRPKPHLVAQLEGHKGTVTTVLWSKHGDQLVSTGNDGVALLWSYEIETCHWNRVTLDVDDTQVPIPERAGRWLEEWNSYGEYRLARDAGEDVRAFRLTSSAAKPNPELSPAYDAAWTWDDRHFIITKENGQVAVFTRSGLRLRKFDASEFPVLVSKLHPEVANRLVTADHKGRIRIWNIFSGALMREFFSTDIGGVLDGCWGDDGSLVLTTGSGHALLYSDVDTSEDYSVAHTLEMREGQHADSHKRIPCKIPDHRLHAAARKWARRLVRELEVLKSMEEHAVFASFDRYSRRTYQMYLRIRRRHHIRDPEPEPAVQEEYLPEPLDLPIPYADDDPNDSDYASTDRDDDAEAGNDDAEADNEPEEDEDEFDPGFHPTRHAHQMSLRRSNADASSQDGQSWSGTNNDSGSDSVHDHRDLDESAGASTRMDNDVRLVRRRVTRRSGSNASPATNADMAAFAESSGSTSRMDEYSPRRRLTRSSRSNAALPSTNADTTAVAESSGSSSRMGDDGPPLTRRRGTRRSGANDATVDTEESSGPRTRTRAGGLAVKNYSVPESNGDSDSHSGESAGPSTRTRTSGRRVKNYRVPESDEDDDSHNGPSAGPSTRTRTGGRLVKNYRVPESDEDDDPHRGASAGPSTRGRSVKNYRVTESGEDDDGASAGPSTRTRTGDLVVKNYGEPNSDEEYPSDSHTSSDRTARSDTTQMNCEGGSNSDHEYNDGGSSKSAASAGLSTPMDSADLVDADGSQRSDDRRPSDPSTATPRRVRRSADMSMIERPTSTHRGAGDEQHGRIRRSGRLADRGNPGVEQPDGASLRSQGRRSSRLAQKVMGNAGDFEEERAVDFTEEVDRSMDAIAETRDNGKRRRKGRGSVTQVHVPVNPFDEPSQIDEVLTAETDDPMDSDVETSQNHGQKRQGSFAQTHHPVNPFDDPIQDDAVAVDDPMDAVVRKSRSRNRRERRGSLTQIHEPLNPFADPVNPFDNVDDSDESENRNPQAAERLSEKLSAVQLGKRPARAAASQRNYVEVASGDEDFDVDEDEHRSPRKKVGQPHQEESTSRGSKQQAAKRAATRKKSKKTTRPTRAAAFAKKYTEPSSEDEAPDD